MTDIVIPYPAHRAYMDSGDVILWHSETALGWLIRKFSHSDVNHTSTIIRTNELGSDRIFVTEALAHGIEMHALSERLKGHKGKAYWLPLKNDNGLSRYGTRKWALDHIDVGYDFSAILQQTHGRVNPDSKRLFCSEFSFLALRDGGAVECLKDQTVAPRPGDMEGLNIFYKRVRIK